MFYNILKKLCQGSMLALGLMSASYAATSTTTTQASASISNTCTLSVSNANLGNLAQTTSTSQKVQTSANISAECTKNTSYTIGITLGANTQGQNRYMKGATSGDLLQYGICSGPNGTVNPWYCPADTNGSTSWTVSPGITHTYVGSGTIQNIPIYIFAPSGYYTPDTYSDTETATMSF